MSVDFPRRALPPIMLPVERMASAWRPGALWAAALRIGIARGYIPPAVAARIAPAITPVETGPPEAAAHATVQAAPPPPTPTSRPPTAPVEATPPPTAVSISPTTPLPTTQTIVIPVRPATPPPAPTPAAHIAPAPVAVAPRGAGMGVHPV
jgi:hypothetical protein